MQDPFILTKILNPFNVSTSILVDQGEVRMSMEQTHGTAENATETLCGVDVVPGSAFDRVLGAIAGVSIGDRMGTPFAGIPNEAIMLRTDGVGVDRYHDPNDWRFVNIDGPFGPAGSGSDALACTLALMDAMADNGGAYDAERSAEALLAEAAKNGTLGWSKPMRFGAKRLENGRWAGDGKLQTVRTWMMRESDIPGDDSGVMKRVSPLGAALLLQGEAHVALPDMVLHVFEEARLTH